MTYLMIQSRGVAPVEAFTLLGASASRGRAEAIGQFGTGNKEAVTTLLRNGLHCRVYCGLDSLDFGTVTSEFDGEECELVVCSQNNKASKALGWTLDWGALDWKATEMALREFISNAIDSSNRVGDYRSEMDDGNFTVGLADTPRAKAGHTRVFVEANDDVLKYVEHIGEHFLHFSGNAIEKSMLPKTDKSGSAIYRMGVYICTLDGEAVYNYNFDADEIKIDECRNSNEYTIRAAIARRVRKASAEELAPIMKAIGERRPVMEAKLDPYYMCPSWDTPNKAEKDAWQTAWKVVYGEAILTEPQSRDIEYVQAKGLRTQSVDSVGWRETLEKFGIKSPNDVLTVAETKGCSITGASTSLYKTVEQVWRKLNFYGIDSKSPFPKVGGFNGPKEVPDSFVNEGCLYVREDLSSDETKLAVLRGLVEYVVSSPPGSHAFEAYICKILLKALLG